MTTARAAMTWEAAVHWYRTQPGQEEAVRDNYFDLPVRGAAERYAQSAEFAEVIRRLGEGGGRTALDLGAGNGIASFALARHGWRVTALEPDPSEEVGAGAIRALAQETGLVIEVVEGMGERLVCEDANFYVVHARQVLHHAEDLRAMAREIWRVLKPGGRLLATRDHVVDDAQQLAQFQQAHPLHRMYGGEHAHSLDEYCSALTGSGLRLLQVWGPLDSVLNCPPSEAADWPGFQRRAVARSWRGVGRGLAWLPPFVTWQAHRLSQRDRWPGRLFSFLAEKP